MSFTIICIVQPENPVQGTYTSAGFDAAVHAELGSAVLPYNGRRYNPDGKQIWLGEGMPAQDTANKILADDKSVDQYRRDKSEPLVFLTDEVREDSRDKCRECSSDNIHRTQIARIDQICNKASESNSRYHSP